MRGNEKVIERLNEALFLELGAVNQYWLHYRLLEDMGVTKFAKKEREESIEEMHHADRLISRIIFLDQGLIIEDGTPREVFEAPKTARFKTFVSAMM